MDVRVFPLGPLETNCYLISNGKEAVVIDPGGNPAPILQYLEQQGLKLTRILNTHLHFDHVLGNAALAKATGATISAGKADTFLLDAASGRRFGLPETEPFSFSALVEGDIPLLGDTCRVFSTPGHSPGSLSYYFPKLGALFAGDVLFRRAVGRTDLPGGDSAALGHSIRTKLYALPEETVVYPGHDAATTIGEEKRENPYFPL